MNDLFQHFEFTLLVYSALFSLIGSFIGFLLQVIVSTILSNRGKVKIYIKSVYNKLFSRTWGFEDSVSGMVFTVPLWIEIHNTTAKKQIIRNLNLVLYKNNSQVAKMTQMNYYEKSNQTFFYGENGAYSFLIDAYEIKRFELFFVTYKKKLTMILMKLEYRIMIQKINTVSLKFLRLVNHGLYLRIRLIMIGEL